MPTRGTRSILYSRYRGREKKSDRVYGSKESRGQMCRLQRESSSKQQQHPSPHRRNWGGPTDPRWAFLNRWGRSNKYITTVPRAIITWASLLCYTHTVWLNSKANWRKKWKQYAFHKFFVKEQFELENWNFS